MATELSFPPFRLDTVNEQLWRDTEPLPLRPKPFAVLRYLVEQAGRLVTQKELRQAVWEHVYVGEAVLRAYVRDLRALLGDDPRHPRFIETIPRRGYRFVGTVGGRPQTGTSSLHPPPALAPRPSAHFPLVSPLSPRSPAPVLVGRADALAQLHTLFGKAVRGERQLIFVTGEPGIGKTALVDAFLEEIMASAVVTARGQCIRQYGSGEAYLPILEALGRLCRRPGGDAVVGVLRRFAPTG